MERDEAGRFVFEDEERPADMWVEFTAARERFFALLARQSAERRAAAAAEVEGDAAEGLRPPRHLVLA